MVGMGPADELEARYMAKFAALVAGRGVAIDYAKDRFGVDTGLQFYVEGTKVDRSGGERRYFHATPVRVWFQFKGIQAGTLSVEEYARKDAVSVQVDIEHLKFWYASPEPVYVTFYVESVGEFLAIDARDYVDQRWGQDFYSQIETYSGDKVAVAIPTDSVLTVDRLDAMLSHRSMRIDGPAFRGRPLGHRIDPLRSQLSTPSDELWTALVADILAAHEFELLSSDRAGDVEVQRGRLRQTLLWQSPALTEIGFSGDPSEIRVEAAPESLFGEVLLFFDHTEDRDNFTDEELRLVAKYTDETNFGFSYAVLLRGPDLSLQGGRWRRTLNETPLSGHEPPCSILGLDVLSYLVLTCTLVYLDRAPQLRWQLINYSH
ncbi:DUF4365 domain-containing protein [Nocardioides sp. BGMRC 2183]|nr:DUF4365 domain-containing protein [Nocardioides sp. BGMRC 2183]